MPRKHNAHRPIFPRPDADTHAGLEHRQVFARDMALSEWREQNHAEPVKRITSPEGALARSLCAIATAAWRLRRTLLESETTPEARRRQHHLATIEDALAEIGVSVQDHDSKPFITGTTLTVLAFQTMAGLTTETVIETIKPSIYLQGQLVQEGEVIVGTPERPGNSKA